MALPTAAELRTNPALRKGLTSAELLASGLSQLEVGTIIGGFTGSFGGGAAKAWRAANGYVDNVATTDGKLGLILNGGTRTSTYNPRAANDLAEISPSAAKLVNAQVDAISPAFGQARASDLAMQAYTAEQSAIWQDISGSGKGLVASTPDIGSFPVQQASARARRRRLRSNTANSTNPTGGRGLLTPANTGVKTLLGA